MKLSRIAACCAIVSALTCAPTSARAQDLLIQPRSTQEEPAQSVEFLLGEAPTEGYADATLQLAAYLQMPDGSLLDVSDAATWQLSDNEIAQLQANDLVFSDFGSVQVSAQFGSLVATIDCHYLERMAELGPEAATAIALSDDGPPVPRQDLSDAAGNLVDGLSDRGIPSDRLNDAANVPILDDRDAFKSPLGYTRRVTNSKTGGMFIPKGISFIGNGLTWFVYTDANVIVLRPDIAEALVAQGEGAVHDHGLSNEAQVLLEELIHNAIKEAGVQDEIGEEAEEAIVKEMITNIVPAMLNISTILSKPQLSQWDLFRLHNNLKKIKQALDRMRQEHGDQAVDLFLQALGWQDADGNGIPDFIDDALEDRGINPDDLPTSPPGGGGGGGGDLEPVDEPTGDPDHPTIKPISPYAPLPDDSDGDS